MTPTHDLAQLWADSERVVVERLVAMNCPPPMVLFHELRTNPAQLAKSWYMLFFQIPKLPEKFVVKSIPGALIGVATTARRGTTRTLHRTWRPSPPLRMPGVR